METEDDSSHLVERLTSLEAVTLQESQAFAAYVQTQEGVRQDQRNQLLELESHFKEQLRTLSFQIVQLLAQQQAQMIILKQVHEKQQEYHEQDRGRHEELVAAISQSEKPIVQQKTASHADLAAAQPTTSPAAIIEKHAEFSAAQPPRSNGDAGGVDVVPYDADQPTYDREESPCSEQATGRTPSIRKRSLSRLSVNAHHEEPISFSNPASIVESDYFELVFGGLILCNTIVMAAQMQYAGRKAGYALEVPRISEPPSWGAGVFEVVDWIFTVIFVAELFLRIVVLRRRFFKSFWGWLDFIVVIVGIADTMGAINVGMDPMMIRLFRLVKLTRCFRMLKMAKFLDVFNLIMKSVAASFSTLFWSMLILMVIQWIAGMVLYQLVFPFFGDESKDLEARKKVFIYYGTFTKTMITMFEVTHVNYSRAARVVMDNIGEAYAWYFIAYRCLISFAVLQVIRAVFIQQTLKVAERDNDLMVRAKQKQMKYYADKLGEMFAQITGSPDGEISLQQFREAIERESMKAWFSAMEIDTHDVEGLFHLLDNDGDGGITVQEFCQGATKLKGAARSIDLFHMSARIKRIENKFND